MDWAAAGPKGLVPASSARRNILRIGYYSLYIWSMGAMQLPPIPENISIIGLRLWACVAQLAIRGGIISRDWSARLEDELLELGPTLEPLLRLFGPTPDETFADHLLEVALRSADLYLPDAGWPKVGQLRSRADALPEDVIVMDRTSLLRLVNEVLRVARDTVSRAEPQGAGIYSLPLTPSGENAQLALLGAAVDEETYGPPARLRLPAPPTTSNSPFAPATERSSFHGRSSHRMSRAEAPFTAHPPEEQWDSPGSMLQIRAARTSSPSPPALTPADALEEPAAPGLDLSPAGPEAEGNPSSESSKPSAPARFSTDSSGGAGCPVLGMQSPVAEEAESPGPRPRIGGSFDVQKTPRSTSSWQSSATESKQEHFSPAGSKSVATYYSSARSSSTSDSGDEEGGSGESEGAENEREGDDEGGKYGEAGTGALLMPRAPVTMSPDVAPGGGHRDSGVGLVWTSSEEEPYLCDEADDGESDPVSRARVL